MHADTVRNFRNYPSTRNRLKAGGFAAPLDAPIADFAIEGSRALAGRAAPSFDGVTPQVGTDSFGGPGRDGWSCMPNSPEGIRQLFAMYPDARCVLFRHVDSAGSEWRHVVDTHTGVVDQVAVVTRFGGAR